MTGYRRPATPAEVERLLRQEAGFGCAKCGHPYIEYHHIVPWAEDQHFRQNDMVALCGNCHPALALQGRDVQRRVKESPFNLTRGSASGALVYDKRDLVFKVGGNWYENTPTILQFHDTPIISCRILNGQAMVSLTLLDEALHQILIVQDNNIVFRTDDLWDFQYSHNNVLARYAPRDIALRIDFRGTEAKIEGRLWFGNQPVQLGADATTLPGNNTMRGCRISAGAVGIQLGDPEIGLPTRCRLPT